MAEQLSGCLARTGPGAESTRANHRSRAFLFLFDGASMHKAKLKPIPTLAGATLLEDFATRNTGGPRLSQTRAQLGVTTT
jgi:hypothetical protein